jgi:hypothetical protein
LTSRNRSSVTPTTTRGPSSVDARVLRVPLFHLRVPAMGWWAASSYLEFSCISRSNCSQVNEVA